MFLFFCFGFRDLYCCCILCSPLPNQFHLILHIMSSMYVCMYVSLYICSLFSFSAVYLFIFDLILLHTSLVNISYLSVVGCVPVTVTEA